MENGSTGQMRSSNPPPACGAACARVRKSRFEFDLTEKRTLPTGGVQNALFRDPNLPECAFPSRRDRRMRFSVRVPAQNAPFRRVRFFSPGQTSSHLTEKRTLPQRLTEKRTLPQRLTEKRTLVPAPHAQAHSAARSGPPPRLSGPATSRIRRLCRCAGSIPLRLCCLWGRSQVWNQASFSTCGCAPAPRC